MASAQPRRGSQYHSVSIREVTRQPKNWSLFRQVARDSCGETFEPGPSDHLMFLYIDTDYEKNKLVGVASYQLANKECEDKTQTDYYHVLNFLLIRSRHQGGGLGGQLLKRVENAMRRHVNRSVKLEAAYAAMKFFAKHGYNIVGDVMETVCPGSERFSRLYPMEKVVQEQQQSSPRSSSQQNICNKSIPAWKAKMQSKQMVVPDHLKLQN